MYGIYANIGGILMVNVTIYSIHGSYGYCEFGAFFRRKTMENHGKPGIQWDRKPVTMWDMFPHVGVMLCHVVSNE